MRRVLLAAAFVVAMLSIARAQPAEGPAVLELFDPQGRLVHGTVTWRIADFGAGPAIAADIVLPELRIDALAVLERIESRGGPSYFFQFWAIRPRSAILGGVPQMGREIAEGLAIFNRETDIGPVALALPTYGPLLWPGSDATPDLDLLRSAGFCTIVARVGILCWSAGQGARAVIDAVLTEWAQRPEILEPILWSRDFLTVPASLRGSRYDARDVNGWVIWELFGDARATLRFRNVDVAIDVGFAAVQQGIRMTVSPLPEDMFYDGGTPALVGLIVDRPTPDGIAVTTEPDGVMITGDPAAIVAWLSAARRISIEFGNGRAGSAGLELGVRNRSLEAFAALLRPAP
ncbi:MAG: hypothetical protein KIT43_10315 [Bauldia sp.]|nr:hypothetical protein [Bauldia sp.]